jgi:hypothetical protein
VKVSHRSITLRLHQRNDGRGIDAARQKRPQRHVGNHLLADGSAQHCFQLIRHLGNAAGQPISLPRFGSLANRPVGDRWGQGFLVGADGQRCSGQQFENVLIHGMRRGNVAMPQVRDQGIAIDPAT